MTNARDLARWLLRILGYFVLWSVVVGLFATQWYVHDAIHGHPWPVGNYIRWSLIEWYTWALLAPLVFWLARRHPID